MALQHCIDFANVCSVHSSKAKVKEMLNIYFSLFVRNKIKHKVRLQTQKKKEKKFTKIKKHVSLHDIIRKSMIDGMYVISLSIFPI
jgi:hypothetical protein